MYSDLIERMVDEQLETDAAVRASVTASAEDVDNALNNIAAAERVSLAKLFEDVRLTTGMTEQEYRQEMRRQVLEGKLVQRLVQDRIRVTDQDLERMFERVVQQERAARQYNPAWIVVRVGRLRAARSKRSEKLSRHSLRPGLALARTSPRWPSSTPTTAPKPKAGISGARPATESSSDGGQGTSARAQARIGRDGA